MNHDNPPRWWSWASLRPLFRGIGQRLLLIGPIILILLIAGGWLGGYFGVPELFWEQNWLKQALAGFSVALLFAEICLVGFLLDAPKPWLRGLPASAPDGWRRSLSGVAYGLLKIVVPEPSAEPEDLRQWRQLRWYLSVTWLPLLAILLGLVLLDPNERWGFLPGLAAALVVVAAFVWVFQRWNAAGAQRRLQAIVAKLPRPAVMGTILISSFAALLLVAWLLPASRPVVVFLLGLWVGTAGLYAAEARYQHMPPEQRWVHGLAGASFGFFFIAYQALFVACLAAPQWSAWLVPPAVALCLLLAQIVAGHGFLKFHFGGWYTAIAALVVALAVGIAGFTGYRHQLRGLEYTGALLDLEAVDFQMEAGDTSDPQRLQRLQNSYERFYKRYTTHANLIGAGQTKVPYQADLRSVAEVRTEQQKLRKAMLGLERQRLDNWKAKLAGAKTAKPKLAVVSVTGGANRSAVWTAFTLAKLERDLASDNVNLPHHIRIITGASGGMVGASYFAATLPGPGGHGFVDDAAIKAFARKVGQDALTPVSQRLLFFDVPGMFVPGGSVHDRGLALEQAWEDYLDKSLETTFEQLAPGEAESWRPSLVLSPMIVEDGRRLLISNLYLGPLIETTGSFLPAEDATAPPMTEESKPPQRPKGRFREEGSRYSITALEFFQLFPDCWSKFKLATAVRLNASFPYVSPVAALPTDPPRHVVDAGYYDNYGVNLAAWWVYHNTDWIREHTSGVVVIQIRDGVSERQRLTPLTTPQERKLWDLQQGLQALTGPATGASRGLQAIMSFRNDEQLQILNDRFNKGAASSRPFFTTVVFECPEEVAMSWYLSDQEIERAMTGFEAGSANERALVRLRQWFKE
jgi:hypothetical protein